MAKRRVRQIANVVDAVRSGDAIYMVMVVYPEPGAPQALGLIPRDHAPRGGEFTLVLNSHDALQSLWASPERSLWAVSAHGHVWTPAPVRWPAPQIDWLEYST